MPPAWPTHLRLDTPNELQLVPLALVVPNEDNVRLFVERTSLATLEAIYIDYQNYNESVALPDAPWVRYVPETGMLKLLAGERRLTAARNVGVVELPMRVVMMSDEEAYHCILAHNDVVGMTTVELAFRAAEMERLGFSYDEISTALKGVSVNRYRAVGRLVNPDLFSDTVKLCDPNISEWFEASEFGDLHFAYCFQHWNEGLWDAKQCSKYFRRRGRALPIDNAEKGFRVTTDGARLVIRGQLDLDVVGNFEDSLKMLNWLMFEITLAKDTMLDTGHFGPRTVLLINPTTLD